MNKFQTNSPLKSPAEYTKSFGHFTLSKTTGFCPCGNPSNKKQNSMFVCDRCLEWERRAGQASIGGPVKGEMKRRE